MSSSPSCLLLGLSIESLHEIAQNSAVGTSTVRHTTSLSACGLSPIAGIDFKAWNDSLPGHPLFTYPQFHSSLVYCKSLLVALVVQPSLPWLVY